AGRPRIAQRREDRLYFGYHLVLSRGTFGKARSTHMNAQRHDTQQRDRNAYWQRPCTHSRRSRDSHGLPPPWPIVAPQHTIHGRMPTLHSSARNTHALFLTVPNKRPL